MHDAQVLQEMKLIHVIVNFGLGSKVLRTAKQHGISGGTVLLGKGTVNNRILDFLGLSDQKKEIVLMVGSKAVAFQAIEQLDKEFLFNKSNHGIAFTTSISSVVGMTQCKTDKINEERVEDTMYQSITIIVEKGKAENVIEAATKAGSKGGTIINARGSGIHETSTLFSMAIEPEKEIVMILSKKENTDKIVEAIREEMKVDQPGNGIIYVQSVDKTYGLFE